MRVWIVHGPLMLRRKGVNLFRAGPEGGILLRGEATWRDINGVGLNTPWGGGIVEFRRVRKGARRIECIKPAKRRISCPQ